MLIGSITPFFAAILLFVGFFLLLPSPPLLSMAQQTTETTTISTTTDQSATTTTSGGSTSSPITFTLRIGDEGADAGEPEGGTANSSSNNLSTRKIGIEVNLIRGNEQAPPISLPINVTIPANVNNLELCASAIEAGTPTAAEMCQPVLRTIDLTQNTATTAGATTTPSSPFSSPSSSPSSSSSSSSAPTMTAPPAPTTTSFAPTTAITAGGGSNSLIADGSGSIEEDSPAFMIPITVIAPITADIQNTRLCAQLPSGTQTCNQIILNPQQTSYTPASVDMTTSPAPTVTSSSSQATGTTDTGGGGGAATSSSSSSSSTTTTSTTTPPGTSSSTPPPTTTTTPPPTSTNNNTNTNTTTGGATSSLPAPGGRDTTSPTLIIPDHMTLQTNGPTALLEYAATAEDNVDGTATLDEDNQLIQGDNVGGSIFISCSPSSQYFLPVGNRTVECRAADAANNTADASFIVSVTPTTSPTGKTDFTPPVLYISPISIGGAASSGTQVTYTVRATDNVDGSATYGSGPLRQDNVGGDIIITCTPVSGALYPIGSTTVWCQAYDAAINIVETTFTVEVPDTGFCQGKDATILGTPGNDRIPDTEGPDVIAGLGGDDVIHAQGGDDIICGGEGNDDLGGYTGNDIISGGAGDDSGMSGGEGNDRMFGDAGVDGMFGDAGNDLMDGGSDSDYGDGGAGIDQCINFEPFVMADSPINCESEGASLVQQLVGNATTLGNATGTLEGGGDDTTSPTVTVPNNMEVETTDLTGTSVTYNVEAVDNVDGEAVLESDTIRQDNVGGSITIACDPPSGSTFPVGVTNTVQCNAYDAAGNVGTASFTITVTSTTPPQTLQAEEPTPEEETEPTITPEEEEEAPPTTTDEEGAGDTGGGGDDTEDGGDEPPATTTEEEGAAGADEGTE
jgi:hypothetical protein